MLGKPLFHSVWGPIFLVAVITAVLTPAALLFGWLSVSAVVMLTIAVGAAAASVVLILSLGWTRTGLYDLARELLKIWRRGWRLIIVIMLTIFTPIGIGFGWVGIPSPWRVVLTVGVMMVCLFVVVVSAYVIRVLVFSPEIAEDIAEDESLSPDDRIMLKVMIGIIASLVPILTVMTVMFAVAAAASLLGLVYLIENVPPCLSWLQSFIPVPLQSPILTGTIVLVSLILFNFRNRHRLWYGVLEALFAIASTWIAATRLLARPATESWLALAASGYLCVRGFDNVHQGSANSRAYKVVLKWIRSKATPGATQGESQKPA